MSWIYILIGYFIIGIICSIFLIKKQKKDFIERGYEEWILPLGQLLLMIVIWPLELIAVIQFKGKL